jgi:hypothetical protein
MENAPQAIEMSALSCRLGHIEQQSIDQGKAGIDGARECAVSSRSDCASHFW